MKRTLNSIFLAFSGLLIIALLPSCQGGGKSSSQKTESTELKKEKVEKEVREFIYPLPTSFEVTEMLNRIEAAYILSLSNPTGNVEKYLTEKSKGLNLGVYGADLSYASTYNQKQETADYMNASKKLVDELDIAAALTPDIVEKIEQNEDNKDELVKIITNSFYDTYEYLNENGRASVSSLVMAGSWVEALYIATHISEDTFNNKEMVKIVMDQKEPLNKLMEILKGFTDNSDIQWTVELLEPLHTIYNSVEEGGITKEQMEAIAVKVKEARDKIVE
ncbi:hypothetical protein DMA11_06865 [Marinilabiliaceae bacterium JC017]|nr:hypothetical protein DMA11_06865 [Marinilabiliaceae bacterium JC017]